jgi:hypothetical protein
MSKRAVLGRRLALCLVAVASALAIAATVAPARVTNVGVTVTLGYHVYETGSVRFGGAVDARNGANYHCEQNRLVELFRDGTKVGSDETEKFPEWAVSTATATPGTYVAKVKRSSLPASLQAKPGKKNRIFCKAAQSAPVVLP